MDPKGKHPARLLHVPFEHEWDVQSPARVFSNPRPTKQRAWERQPRARHQPSESNIDNVSKPRTIWKRLDVSSALSQHGQPASSVAGPSHAKAVKKIKLDTALDNEQAVSQWDRRRSSLPHKTNTHDATPEDLAPDSLHGQALPIGGLGTDNSLKINPFQQSNIENLACAESTSISTDAQDTGRRKLRPRSSLSKRRKTDFFTPKTPLSPSSRKRRFTDGYDNANNSLPQPCPPADLEKNHTLEDHTAQGSLVTVGILKSQPIAEVEQDSKNTTFTLQGDNGEKQELLVLPLANSSDVDSEEPKPDPEIQLIQNSAKDQVVVYSELQGMLGVEGCVSQHETKRPLTSSDESNVMKAHVTSEVPEHATCLVISQDAPQTPPRSNCNISHVTEQTEGTALLEQTDTTSPGVSPEDNDQTSTITVVLNDDDTDILHDFLNRAKASKAAKIAEQSSLLNRRDSDAIKTALASPGKPLEDIDPNSPSPRKLQNPSLSKVGHADFGGSENQELGKHPDVPVEQTDQAEQIENDQPDESSRPARRSKRHMTSPTVPTRSSSRSGVPPNMISVRMQDQSETLVLKKSEAQELALVTRNNTRRNKGGAIPARLMLLKLKSMPGLEDPNQASDLAESGKVKWNEDLVSYFQEPDVAYEEITRQSDNSNAATVPEESKPRARRAKTLGAMNGTPARQRTRDRELAAVFFEDDTTDLQIPQLFDSDASTSEDKAQLRAIDHVDGNATSISHANRSEKRSQPPPPDQPNASTRALRRLPTPAKPTKIENHQQPPQASKLRYNNTSDGAIEQPPASQHNQENRDPKRRLFSKAKAGSKILSGAVPSGTAAARSGAVGEAKRRTVAPRKASTAV